MVDSFGVPQGPVGPDAGQQPVRQLAGEEDLGGAGDGPDQQADEDGAGGVVDRRSAERDPGQVGDLDGDRGAVAGADLDAAGVQASLVVVDREHWHRLVVGRGGVLVVGSCGAGQVVERRP